MKREGNDGSVNDAQSQLRFMTAWSRIEAQLAELYLEGRVGRERAPDSVVLIDWAEDERHLTRSQARFLGQCRRARNAYSHVAFDDYHGPLGFPPKDVTDRMERVLAGLVNPPKASAALPRATTCDASTPIRDALAVLREEDFSQLPYRHDDRGWLLVTRSQIAAWVEHATQEDGACLLDLNLPVRHLADEAGPGPIIPRMLTTQSRLSDVVLEMEQAFITPDHEPGGYPCVLVTEPSGDNAPFLMAPDDLPHAYRLLGR